MFCILCGRQIPDDSNYCRFCGEKLPRVNKTVYQETTVKTTDCCFKPNTGIAGFIDVETTGLNPASDEVVEFAICLFEFKRDSGEITNVIDQYIGLREPVKPIPSEVVKIHGITHEVVKGKRLDKAVIEAMVQRAEFLISHNAQFDYGFVSRLFDFCCNKPWLCSMRGIDWRSKGFSSMALQKLLRDHGIKVDKAHRAEHDVRAAIELLSKSDSNGRIYFSELLKYVHKIRGYEPVHR